MAEDNKQQEQDQEQIMAGEEAAQAETSAAESPEGAESVEADELSPEQQLDALREELAETREQALRTAAEAQNIRRRAEIDAENTRKFAIERFARDLLPVVDNLERALASVDTKDESMTAVLEGVELTHRSFADMLERHNLKVINPEGEPFDPQLHEAISMVESPDAEPNSVIQVVQKGYTLNDRLLRAAMVVVSK